MEGDRKESKSNRMHGGEADRGRDGVCGERVHLNQC